ncbi:MAG TPA: GDP-mannose 4,6-dehydratase, partial [Solimonas sp.]
ACRIAAGSKERLQLGNLDIDRDWGWAPEYVEAMWRMMQQPAASDFVIATGQTRSLTDFVSAAFSAVGLDWKDHVDSNPALKRPTDLRATHADTRRAERQLGWRAQTLMDEVARKMVQATLSNSNQE